MKFKTQIMILGLGTILSSTALTGTAFAFGQSPPAQQQEQPIANKSAFLEQAVREFNAKYADIKYGPNVANDGCYSVRVDHSNDFDTLVPKANSELCNQISSLFEYGMTCSDFVIVSKSDLNWSDVTDRQEGIFGYSYTCTSEGHAKLVASLTPKAQQLMQSSFFYDQSNASVDYNVRSIQSGLSHLQLLPRQRKALDGFFNATDAFVKKIDAEKAKAANGEKALPLTHRSFVDQASLLAAYYRYLKDDFTELAQFGSAADGVSQVNKQSVEVINTSIQHIIDAYGLDADVTAKQVADYGRVLLDLLNNYSLTLTTSEKATVQPVMVQLVTQVIPASEAYGDVGAHDAVVKLKTLWESQAFSDLLTDKLSVSDDKSTTLILNMSAAAYKIGLSANVDIKTFDARDAERIKSQKGRN